jgi:hypothetical protein
MKKATTATIFFLVCLTSLLVSFTSSVRPPHRTYRNDIFIPGTKEKPTWYYAPTGEDFMAKWGLLPGDTIAFKIGPNGEDLMNNVDLSMTNVNGITFINDSSNKKDFLLGWFGLGRNCQDVKFMGNGSKYVYYGFTLWEPKNIGLSWSCVGNSEAAYFLSNGNAMGVQLVAIPGVVYPLNYQKFHLHNATIKNSNQEAVYIGYAHYNGSVLIDFTGDSITVRNAGRDGIQTRNTSKTLIENNDIDSVGMLHDSGHDHGILLGDNINGAIVRNNKLRNVQGIGIWNDGWGDFFYECNNIQSVWWGMMTRNIAVLNGENTDPQNIGYVHHVLKNNTFAPGNGITVESYFDGAGKTNTIEAYNNQCPDVFKLVAGITFLHSNNTPATITQCATSKPVILPVHLESFTASRKQRAILIQWSASESAFDHYELQKSTDGNRFQLFARVSGGQRQYEQYDLFPADMNYYRLKMIDQDGAYTYSKIILLQMKGAKYQVFNIGGQYIGSNKEALKKGFYFIKYDDGTTERYYKE